MKKLLIIVAVFALVLGARTTKTEAVSFGGYAGPVSIQVTGASMTGDSTFIPGAGETVWVYFAGCQRAL